MARPNKGTLTERGKKVLPTRIRKLMDERRESERLNGRKYTFDMLAEALGTTRQAAQTYYSGDADPNWEMIVKIAKCFNVSVDWLLGEAPEEIRTRDTTKAAICEFTGLSEYALDVILHCKECRLIEELNYVLEYGDSGAEFLDDYGANAFVDFLGSLYSLKRSLTDYRTPEDFEEVEVAYKGFAKWRDYFKSIGFFLCNSNTYVSATIHDCTTRLDKLMRDYISPEESKQNTDEAKNNENDSDELADERGEDDGKH